MNGWAEILHRLGGGGNAVPPRLFIRERCERLAINTRGQCAHSLAATEFAAALDQHDFSVQKVARRLLELGRMQKLEVSVEFQELYRSVNEPQDLA